MKVVTVQQMRDLEQGCVAQGTSLDTLMENAGLAVARHAAAILGTVAASRVVVLVGPGNNGGDGLVVARHLQRWGAAVTAYIPRPRPDVDPKLDLALREGARVSGLETLDGELRRCHLAIDAVLGTGRARPLEGAIKETLVRLDSARQARDGMKVLALDLPSGLNADTGEVDPACPYADVTVTLGYPKVGLLQFPGATRVGRLEVADIGIPGHLASGVSLELMTAQMAASCLLPRPPDGHKGTFGHALVVAGSRRFVGAAYLASQAAVRVGAGLVTAAAPEGIHPMLAAKLTEAVHLPLPQDQDGIIDASAAHLVKERMSGYSALMVGCGLGQSEGAVHFIEGLLLSGSPLGLPVLVDADGLNNLARIPDWWQRLSRPAVLTPHPGEMATLTGLSTREVQADRLGVAQKHASRWGVTLVLKGAHTVIAGPEGASFISPFANPGLASGGTGDVLSGVIAGFMAQRLDPLKAAVAGVYLHGVAGEDAAAQLGSTGMVAGDLLDRLPIAIKRLRQVR